MDVKDKLHKFFIEDVDQNAVFVIGVAFVIILITLALTNPLP